MCSLILHGTAGPQDVECTELTSVQIMAMCNLILLGTVGLKDIKCTGTD